MLIRVSLSMLLTLTYQVFDEAFEADTMNKDMVTKNLVLALAVIELVCTPNSISRAGSEIIEWLGRERINKPDYLYRLEKSGPWLTRTNKACLSRTKSDDRKQRFQRPVDYS
jgi:hypothetical protein